MKLVFNSKQTANSVRVNLIQNLSSYETICLYIANNDLNTAGMIQQDYNDLADELAEVWEKGTFDIHFSITQ